MTNKLAKKIYNGIHKTLKIRNSYYLHEPTFPKIADCCLIIPTVNKNSITPHAEAFQGVIWHLLVSHPKIKKYKTKW